MNESSQNLNGPDLVRRAAEVIPGGVNSPVRAYMSVGGDPIFIESGSGAYVTDVDGNRYIDYVQSYGASILGHAHPEVTKAIHDASSLGATFGAPTPGEVLLAEEICTRIDGMDQVRLVSSGTEATMSAIRLARGATGRSKIVKFAGHYHGHSDALLAAGGSGVANQGLSGSAGVTAGAVSDTVVVPWNVVPTLDEDVAVLIVEPIAANIGLVPPSEGFIEALRNECDRVGALLLFDEVITGFRLRRGGAGEYFGVTPDLWCFGKIIGGGLPMGAFGGRREIMSSLAPLGDVYQAGTLSGNPVATAAGLTALGLLTKDAYELLAAKASLLAEGLRAAFEASSVPAQVPNVGPLLSIFFGDVAPTNYDEAKASVDLGLYPAFFWGMTKRGVALAPGPYEVMFPSLAHSDEDIAKTIEAAHAAAAEL